MERKESSNPRLFDGYHKELMNLYNETLNNCSGIKADERAFFDKMIDAFISFISQCFYDEEQVLAEKSYGEYAEHKLAHTKLLETIRLIKREVEANTWEMNLGVLTKTIKGWLEKHHNTYDINAQDHLNSEQVKPAEMTA